MAGRRVMRAGSTSSPTRGSTGSSGGGSTGSPTGFDPSTWGGQARMLARNDADAAALLLAAGLIVADMVTVVIALRSDLATWRDVFSGDGLLLFGLQASAVAAAWVLTYARSLRADTLQVRRQTWQQELADDEDHDGDGFVGDPTRGITVRHHDGQEEVIEVDLPARSAPGAPVIPAWGVSLPDLVAILFEADLSRGLQERAWVPSKKQPLVTAFVLPSGQRVTQGMFRQVLAEMDSRGWAVKSAGRWELAVEPEAVAKALKASPSPASGVRDTSFSAGNTKHALSHGAHESVKAVKA